MSRNLFSEKLAASTRKAKKTIPEVKQKSESSLVANKNKVKKKIPAVKPKSAPPPELLSPNDLLNPTDSELPLKQQYAERIWPD